MSDYNRLVFMTFLTDQNQNPQELCRSVINHYERKANHNKSEALWCFTIVIACTLTTPLFITLGPGLLLGKIVPSALSVVAAGATAWLQQRKPHQLWSLYRTAQRYLEVQELKHHFLIEEYQETADRDKLLAKDVAETIRRTHYEWLPIVPSPENLKLLESNSKQVRDTQAQRVPRRSQSVS